MADFKFFHDSALTEEVTSLNPFEATQGGGLGPVDTVVYLGCTDAGIKIQDSTNPGVDPIQVQAYDSDTGSGAPATEFKFALSSGGLASATAGAALNLSHTINSGVANAVPIHVRRTSAITVVGTYTDAYPRTSLVVSSPV